MSTTQYGKRPIHTPDRVFLIGDVHNCADKLMSLLDQIEPLLTPNDHVVFLGDLIDRGNQPALTIETLVDFAKKYTNQVYFVVGNHDWMLQNFLQTGSRGWMEYLSTTLIPLMGQWNLTDIEPHTVAKALLDHNFKEITSRMVPYYETDRVIATHAPIDRMIAGMYGSSHYKEDYKDRLTNPGFNYFLEKIEYELLWTFCDEAHGCPDIDKFLVCGHQPGSAKHPRIFKDHAFIDTGAGKGDRPITCLEYPSKKYYQSK